MQRMDQNILVTVSVVSTMRMVTEFRHHKVLMQYDYCKQFMESFCVLW